LTFCFRFFFFFFFFCVSFAGFTGLGHRHPCYYPLPPPSFVVRTCLLPVPVCLWTRRCGTRAVCLRTLRTSRGALRCGLRHMTARRRVTATTWHFLLRWFSRIIGHCAVWTVHSWFRRRRFMVPMQRLQQLLQRRSTAASGPSVPPLPSSLPGVPGGQVLTVVFASMPDSVANELPAAARLLLYGDMLVWAKTV